jgi:hypothetical protein
MGMNVRFSVPLLLSVALAGLGGGCNNNRNAGVYADLSWRLRCGTTPGCLGYPDREVAGFNGERGFRISCTVSESETTRTLNFSASGGGYGISVINAQIPRSGTAPVGTGCLLTVQEDNIYEGACGSGPPTPSQPCQMSRVEFTRDEEGRPLVQGSIYCVQIAPRAIPTIDRNLTAPGNGPSADMMPMSFRFFDCTGYQPD